MPSSIVVSGVQQDRPESSATIRSGSVHAGHSALVVGEKRTFTHKREREKEPQGPKTKDAAI
jgi:hypothetical protein